jgi:uncharacterized protein with von Willebrand factor type A (vWA) domain
VFLDFFYLLRAKGIPVSLTEWLTLTRAVAMGLEHQSLDGFYTLCRALCVKSEAHFDLYDRCFAAHFQGAQAPESVKDELLRWLEDPIAPRRLTQEEVDALEALDLEELRRQFEERLAEQDERHDGGSHWVGTGGSSPFGHGGQHPSGIRVGGKSGRRSAMQVASKRRFANLRHDRVLDVRQISVALRKLRRLAREGRREELDLEGTIDATARNAGDIDMVFHAERKNSVKLLLLMDVGGSMTPWTRLCERLFSAAHGASHFQAFKHYYFHNCPYETLYSDMSRREGKPTMDVLRELDDSWFCVVVGDAAMHPYELAMPGGSVDYFHQNAEAGLVWLWRIQERFPRAIWLNPEPTKYWYIQSVQMIREVFEMFPLTLEGLEEGLEHLLKARPGARTSSDQS